jgi:hypothetical protein
MWNPPLRVTSSHGKKITETKTPAVSIIYEFSRLPYPILNSLFASILNTDLTVSAKLRKLAIIEAKQTEGE